MRYICNVGFKVGKSGKLTFDLPDTSHLGDLLQARYDELTRMNRERQVDVTNDTKTCTCTKPLFCWTCGGFVL